MHIMDRNKNYSLGLYEKAMPAMSFREMISAAKKSGFDRLEISIDESDYRLSRLNWSADKRKELVSISQDYDIPIKTMCLSGHRKYPFGSHDSVTREKSIEIMEKAIDFACDTQIRIIQLAGYDVYYEEHDEWTEGWFLVNLENAVEYASKCGIILGFETMETSFMDTVKKAMKYVNLIGSPWLGIYPDIGNLKNASLLYGNSVYDDLLTGKGHIFAMHLKETKPGVYRDMRFGTGHTEYADCLQFARNNGINIFTGEFWYKDGQSYPAELLHASNFLRNKIGNAGF